MAGGEGFEFCECGFADVNCKGFAIRRGSGGYAPLWCWEHNVGGELGYVGFGTVEEAGAVELVGGEGEFEGGRRAGNLALADWIALH